LVTFAARTAEGRQAGRAARRELLSEIDWVWLAESLRKRRLLPALGPRILEIAGEDGDAGFADAVDHAMAAARPHALALMLVGARVTGALAAAGIAATPLKGPHLGEMIYGAPERRVSSDIDLLVAPHQLDQAVAVVRGMGYGAPADEVGAAGLPLLHFALEHPQMPTVELHWRIHWYEDRFAHERLVAPRGAAPGWRPAPADELASLLLFYARDGFVGLRLAVDLSAWWDSFGAAIEPRALDAVITAYPRLRRALLVSLAVAERVIGLPAARVATTPSRLRVRDRMAVRLADPSPRVGEAQQYADMGFVDGLLTPVSELGAFLRRQVFLSREVIAEYARLNDTFRAGGPISYALRVLARYSVSAARTLRTLHPDAS
jgi:hypothetical protein